MAAVLTETVPTAPGAPHRARPAIIQGGMGVAVSGWRLAREVSLRRAPRRRVGHRDGCRARPPPAGRRRGRPLPPGAGPLPESRRWPARAWTPTSCQGGQSADRPYRRCPSCTPDRPRAPAELAVVAQLRRGLARQGRPRRPRRHQLPREDPDRRRLPPLLRRDARRRRLRAHGRRHPARGARRARRARGRRGGDASRSTSPAGDGRRGIVESTRATCLAHDLPPLRRPSSSPSSRSTAGAIPGTRDPRDPPDGFVVEGPPAGGHNAPPRGQPAAQRARRAGLRRRATWSTSTKMRARPAVLDGRRVRHPRAGRRRPSRPARPACRSAPRSPSAQESGLTRCRPRPRARPPAGRRPHRAHRPAGLPDRLPVQGGRSSRARCQPGRGLRGAPRLCDLGYLRQPYERAERHGWAIRCAGEPVHTYL